MGAAAGLVECGAAQRSLRGRTRVTRCTDAHASSHSLQTTLLLRRTPVLSLAWACEAPAHRQASGGRHQERQNQCGEAPRHREGEAPESAPPWPTECTEPVGEDSGGSGGILHQASRPPREASHRSGSALTGCTPLYSVAGTSADVSNLRVYSMYARRVNLKKYTRILQV